jgi:hypothetical protein
MMVLPAAAVAVPAQLFVNPGVGATAKPEGSVSKSAKPDSLMVFAGGLVMVKVKLVVPFSAMLAAPKASPIEGGAATAIAATALPPVPPSVDVTLPVVLIGAPAAVPVTFIENVHDAFAARLAPLRLIRLVAWEAVMAPPSQVPARPLGVAMINPAGSVSLKPTPVSPTALPAGLVIVKLKVADPFSGMLGPPKASLIVGGAATARLAEAVFPVPPLVESTVTLLFFAPAVVPVTFKLSVQEAPAARVPPDRLTADEPVAAAAVPVQVVVKPFGVATTRPDGKLSLNPTPLNAIALTDVLLTV